KQFHHRGTEITQSCTEKIWWWPNLKIVVRRLGLERKRPRLHSPAGGQPRRLRSSRIRSLPKIFFPTDSAAGDRSAAPKYTAVARFASSNDFFAGYPGLTPRAFMLRAERSSRERDVRSRGNPKRRRRPD